MDPTIAIPAHFTLEILSVVAMGLVLAWAVYGRRWIAALGALSFGIASALHAGSFIAADDDVAIVVLRLFGVAALVAGAYTVKIRRTHFFAGVALLFGGALWGAFAGGSASSLTVGPHVLGALGAIVLLFWSWFVTRPSVRLRLLASFVLVLGVAVIVTGGSVSRVAAVEKRDEEYGKLGPTAAVVREQIGAIGTDLATRAAMFSPQLAPRLRTNPTLSGIALRSTEVAASLDPSGNVIGVQRSGSPSVDPATIASTDSFRSALAGSVASAYRLVDSSTGNGIEVIGAAPVFRPGGTPAAADVIGVVGIVRPLRVDVVESMATAVLPGAHVAVADKTGNGVSTIGAKDLRDTVSAVTTFRTLDTSSGRWPAVITPLDDSSGITLTIAVPASLVVDATRTLVHAFLIALLASALLSVAVALWLSARITRPMTDLVDEGERLKTDFLASVSHELRTPLTPIRGYTEILRRGRVPARRASGYLDEIGIAAQRLERIVSLLVDVASMEAGRFHINIEDLPVRALADEAAARWKHGSADHPVRVTADEGLPDVKADGVAIGRVLDELIDNAIKFSPDGSIVSVGAETKDGGVTFSVRDEGQGIEPERLAELGNAFEQIDSGDTRRFGGLGLGLNYVRGVLRAHDSRLVIESEPGAGTTSSFTLASTGIVTPMPAKAKATRSRKASKSKVR